MILVGLLGLFNNPILGIFKVNMLHNWVHIISGIVALIFAFQSDSAARGFAWVFGIVYALVAIYGFVAPASAQKLLAVNMADNILHVLLAIIFIVAGSMKPKMMADQTPQM